MLEKIILEMAEYALAQQYNPFEPDNQSERYKIWKLALEEYKARKLK